MIGLLFHMEDCEKIGNFLCTFYDEMPVDWLIDYFYRLKAKSGKVLVDWSDDMFTHIGTNSTLPGQVR